MSQMRLFTYKKLLGIMNCDVFNKKITSSRGNYLKILLELSGGGKVCSSDVAEALGITKTGVSCMMKRLSDEGHIAKEKYGTVTLMKKI
ncbi:hypothetical protein SDC9_200688 [bioreactor metagenome]|uniref:HTH dtxR-type domain-containing protein n=1 Tax=bioreactor metagenome TaxID=1076179 RepID=A0A645INV3_9ZZZZ